MQDTYEQNIIMKVDVSVVSIPSFKYCLATHVSLNLIYNIVTEYIRY